MKETAVEWLIQEHFGGIENCTPDFRYHIEQAKEMEKQMNLQCYEDGYNRVAKLIEDATKQNGLTFKSE